MTKEDYLREYFGEPISIYTDADALGDGTLVDITALKLAFESCGQPNDWQSVLGCAAQLQVER